PSPAVARANVRPASPPHSLHAPPPPALHPLSLHDALPISSPFTVSSSPVKWIAIRMVEKTASYAPRTADLPDAEARTTRFFRPRSEEHTSELQSRGHLACRLLLGKKKMYATSGTQGGRCAV